MERDEELMKALEELMKENPEIQKAYEMAETLFDGEDEEVEIDAIEIDGKEYLITQDFELNGNRYVLLVDENNPRAMMYRKIVIEDGQEYLVGLDSEEEVETVMEYNGQFLMKDLFGMEEDTREETNS